MRFSRATLPRTKLAGERPSRRQEAVGSHEALKRTRLGGQRPVCYGAAAVTARRALGLRLTRVRSPTAVHCIDSPVLGECSPSAPRDLNGSFRPSWITRGVHVFLSIIGLVVNETSQIFNAEFLVIPSEQQPQVPSFVHDLFGGLSCGLLLTEKRTSCASRLRKAEVRPYDRVRVSPHAR